MRRTLPVLLTATLLLAACGSDDDSGNTESSSDPTVGAADVPDSTDPTDGAAPSTDGAELATPPTNPDKPSVEIPAEIPTELQVTVVEEGSGPGAEDGDTVIVDYVGVRSSDGVEFDNSYDRFQPFPVVLGQGGVIAGWDQGLVGAQAGSRITLDIPSDLAYGEQSQGDIIGENEALTFLIDVRAVVPPADPADAPTEPGVEPSAGATGVTTVDITEGDGAAVEAGQTALVRYAIFRGDNGVALTDNWDQAPTPIPVTEDGFPVFYEGLVGMQVGGRRAITFPPEYPEFGFGPEGTPASGLPADTDVIIVVDLVGVWGTPT
jgi:peptidylprolyl isomerase